MELVEDWWKRLAEGMFPAEGLKELIARRAGEGGEWVVAWALLRVAEALEDRE